MSLSTLTSLVTPRLIFTESDGQFLKKKLFLFSHLLCNDDSIGLLEFRAVLSTLSEHSLI